MSRIDLDLEPEQYHAYPAVSSGAIRTFALQGPWMYCARHITHEIESEDSNAKQLGRASHAACTDPSYFDKHWGVIPSHMPNGDKINRTYKEHKTYIDPIRAEAKEKYKEIVTEKELEEIRQMVNSVMDNPAAARYLTKDAGVEKAVINNDEETGLKVKALVDLDLGTTIVDLKTTRRSTVGLFIADAINFGYDYQAAHYLDVTGANEFIILGVRNKPPYEAMAYKVPDEDIRVARDKNHETLRKIKECYELGSWHSIGWGELNLLRRDK